MSELSDVAEVFAEFLASHETGGDDDIEPVCRTHPHLADRLRKMHADWRHLESTLGTPQPLATGERYERGECLARGGMGVIWRVYDHHLRRELAMKTLHAPDPNETSRTSADPRSLSRFLDEARITGQLQHPGIPAVHDLGIDAAGQVFFTMPLLSGQTLRDIVVAMRNGDAAWPMQRVLGVLLKACEAVAYAHAQGVIHRDLKPANVMVGRFGEAWVMDWGLARVLGDAAPEVAGGIVSERATLARREPASPLLTHLGDVVGTPVYMPPEQARGDRTAVGPRADVYAAGAMLYEVLAGSPPYGADSASSQIVIARLLAGPPPALEHVSPTAPRELAAICERAMAWRADDRYADMGEFVHDLRAWLELRVVRAYGGGSWAAFQKLVRRNKVASVAVFAAALAMVVGTVVSVRQVGIANESNALSLEAVDRMLERVASNRLDDVPRAYPVRQELVQDALALYERMLERNGDDAETRARLARCWAQLGRVQVKLGDTERAITSQQNAIAAYDRLALEQAADRRFVTGRATARASLGAILTKVGDVATAELQLRSAIAELQTIPPSDQSASVLALRVSVHGQLGTLMQRTNRVAVALEQKQEMVALSREIVKVDGGPAHREGLARSLDQLGNTLFEMDQPRAAAPHHEEAVAILATLFAAQPDKESVRANYAAALTNLGRCLDVEERDAEALAAWRRAVTLWRAIADEHAEVPTYRSALGTTLGNIARVETDGSIAEASWNDAVAAHANAVAKAGRDLAFREEWLRHLRDRTMWLCEHARHRQAVQSAAELAAALPADPDLAFEAAVHVGHAVRSATADPGLTDEDRANLVTTYRHEGLQHLRQAVERGCRDRTRFESEHLAFLRGDAGYAELLATLPPR